MIPALGRVTRAQQCRHMFGRISWATRRRYPSRAHPRFRTRASGRAGPTTHVFGPSRNSLQPSALATNWVSEFRFGIQQPGEYRVPAGRFTEDNQECPSSACGGPGGINNDNGIALIGGGNGRWIEYLGDFGQYIIPQRTFQFAGSVTWLRGAHTLKSGASFIHRRVSTERSQFGKGFYFYPFGDDPGPAPCPAGSASRCAEMLAGTTDFTITGYPSTRCATCSTGRTASTSRTTGRSATGSR